MADENRIHIEITGDPTGAVAATGAVEKATQQLSDGTKSVWSSLQSYYDAFKKNWLEITAGITGAYLAFQKVFSLMDAAAEHAERMETLDALTRRYGSSAQELTGIIAENSHGLIGLAASANVATDALAKGFTPSQVAQMASWAVTMQKTSSEAMTSSEAFKTLEQSLTSARERGVVKLMGATIDLQASMGAQYATMTKAQKAQELFNAVGEQAAKVQRVLGDEFNSEADQIQRFKNQIDAVKLTVGDFALRVSAALFGAVQSIAGSVSIIIGGILKVFELSSMLTDKAGLTQGAAQNWREAADAARMSGEDLKKKAQENYDLALNGSKAAKAGSMEALGGDLGVNMKRQEQLTEILRKYAQERDLIDAAEKDKELVRLNFWFDEQVKKLHDLGAGDAEYSALVRTYAEKRHDDIAAWATKTSDFYLEVQRANVKENDEIEKERNAALYREAERGARERAAVEETYSAAWGITDESDAIRRRAQGEQEILRSSRTAWSPDHRADDVRGNAQNHAAVPRPRKPDRGEQAAPGRRPGRATYRGGTENS